MQVVSGSIGKSKVHFQSPPSAPVPAEMDAYLHWFNKTGPHGPEPLPALTRAGLAHLYFESIHPFEDGNGRIGRAISEKALAQSFDPPIIVGLATAILARHRSYYEALESANKRNEVTEWLGWFADTALEAQRLAVIQTEFLLEKTKLLDRLHGKLNSRQEKAILRMLQEGPKGFEGGLSAGNYGKITGASSATATRDLAALVAEGALIRTGERKHTRYELPISRRP